MTKANPTKLSKTDKTNRGQSSSAEIQQAMIAAYLEGKTQAAAAGLFGYDHSVCRGALIRAGIPIRSRQEAAAMNRRHPFNERFFQVIDSEAKAYWLGFISADGTINDANHSLQVTLARRDRGHLRCLADALSCPTAIVHDCSYTRDGKRYLTSAINFFSSATLADLAALGVIPRKSLTISPWHGSEELMRHYWRGVVDGDGCLHARKNGYWSVSLVGSYDIVAGFASFISQITGSTKDPKTNGNIFQVSYGGTGLPQAIATLLYKDANVFLPRKQKIAARLMTITPHCLYGSRRNFEQLTKEQLEEQFAVHGSWYRVAKVMGVTPPQLVGIRRRLGMFIGKARGR